MFSRYFQRFKCLCILNDKGLWFSSIKQFILGVSDEEVSEYKSYFDWDNDYLWWNLAAQICGKWAVNEW